MKAVLAIVTVIIISNMVVGDPIQTGGASCSTFKDCGGIDKGYCDGNTINGTFNGSCICCSKYGNPDCTYNRFSKDLTGGLQFLCFAGFIWSIVDGALILQGKITDPNGYSLY